MLRRLAILTVFLLWTTQALAMEASYYSVESLKKEGTWRYSHGQMANGRLFKDGGSTCASLDYRLGTRLAVRNLLNGKAVVVTVTDRTNKRYKGKRVDLSISAMCQIDGIKQGIVPCKVEVIP